MKHTLTHAGWFGLCPVHLGDLHTDSPLVIPRWSVLQPLLSFSAMVFETLMSFMELCGLEPPGYPIAVGQELPQPRVVDIPEGDEA